MFNNKILEPTQTYRPQKSCERKRQVQGKKKPRTINSGAGNTSSEEKDKQKV